MIATVCLIAAIAFVGGAIFGRVLAEATIVRRLHRRIADLQKYAFHRKTAEALDERLKRLQIEKLEREEPRPLVEMI